MIVIKDKIIEGLIEDLQIAKARLAVETNEAEIAILKEVILTFEAHLKHFTSVEEQTPEQMKLKDSIVQGLIEDILHARERLETATDEIEIENLRKIIRVSEIDLEHFNSLQ